MNGSHLRRNWSRSWCNHGHLPLSCLSSKYDLFLTALIENMVEVSGNRVILSDARPVCSNCIQQEVQSWDTVDPCYKADHEALEGYRTTIVNSIMLLMRFHALDGRVNSISCDLKGSKDVCFFIIFAAIAGWRNIYPVMFRRGSETLKLSASVTAPTFVLAWRRTSSAHCLCAINNTIHLAV